jgi:potassium-transporting ATPase KdpC subunit
MNNNKKSVIAAAKMILFFTLLCGLIYPLLITGLAQIFFPGKANGSLIQKDGKVIGSELIGQLFTDSAYFWSRPSATGYGTLPGGGSNSGPTSSDLRMKVEARRKAFLSANHLEDDTPVPTEMLTASGSGLDPHISQKSAMLQISRIANIRKFDQKKTQKLLLLVQHYTEKPQFSLFGEERVNVLMLNLELDKMQ